MEVHKLDVDELNNVPSALNSLKSEVDKLDIGKLGQPSNDGVTIKMLYGVDVLHGPALHPIFSY